MSVDSDGIPEIVSFLSEWIIDANVNFSFFFFVSICDIYGFQRIRYLNLTTRNNLFDI